MLDKRALKTILIAGIVAGTLDILAAIVVYALVMQATTAMRILQMIASGVFGKAAFDGGAGMAICGLVFHYDIAFCWAAAYIFVYRFAPFLRRHKIAGGLLYGALVWALMNLVVLPLSRAPHNRFTWDSVLSGALILMVCIGLPVALIADKFYNRQTI